jgi:hypothetical protein
MAIRALGDKSILCDSLSVSPEAPLSLTNFLWTPYILLWLCPKMGLLSPAVMNIRFPCRMQTGRHPSTILRLVFRGDTFSPDIFLPCCAHLLGPHPVLVESLTGEDARNSWGKPHPVSSWIMTSVPVERGTVQSYKLGGGGSCRVRKPHPWEGTELCQKERRILTPCQQAFV